MASSKIPAPVRVFSKLLFPAEVYPTRAATFRLESFRCVRINSRCCSTSRSSFFNLLIRSRIKRLSISSFFSPGPLVPIPPPSLDNEFPSPIRRDALYFNCASSTCILPSLDTALAAKISRINSVRSMILHPNSCSRFFNCTDVSSSSQIIPVASVSHNSSLSSVIFPFPI